MYRQHKKNRAYTPKHGRKARPMSRTMAVVIAMLLVLCFTAGGTLAYLAVKSATASNDFTPARVACSVGSGGSITNTGTVDAYIRAAVVVNWVDDDGNVYAANPAYDAPAATGWAFNSAQGYYYYSAVVPSGTTISAPASVSVTGANPDASKYSAKVEYLAEAIQAAGTTDSTDIPAYQDAWKIGSISG